MIDDLDPDRAATLFVQRYGKDAARHAAQWATAMLEAGNPADARKFERIAAAIGDLARGARPTPVRREQRKRRRG